MSHIQLQVGRNKSWCTAAHVRLAARITGTTVFPSLQTAPPSASGATGARAGTARPASRRRLWWKAPSLACRRASCLWGTPTAERAAAHLWLRFNPTCKDACTAQVSPLCSSFLCPTNTGHLCCIVCSLTGVWMGTVLSFFRSSCKCNDLVHSSGSRGVTGDWSAAAAAAAAAGRRPAEPLTESTKHPQAHLEGGSLGIIQQFWGGGALHLHERAVS